MGCLCCTSYTFSSLKFQTLVSCPIFTLFVSNIKRKVTCIRSKETRHFHHFRDFFFFIQPTNILRPKIHLSSLENQKPCEHHYHDRLRWQILDQRCNSRASRNVGSKNACSVFVFFFIVEISGLATRLILLPRQSWRRGHWSSMFPLKFLPTVGKSRR